MLPASIAPDSMRNEVVSPEAVTRALYDKMARTLDTLGMQEIYRRFVQQ